QSGRDIRSRRWSTPTWPSTGRDRSMPPDRVGHDAPDGTRTVARPRLLFVVTEDWYFRSHRLALAKAAIAAGFDVAVATRIANHGGAIEEAGVRAVPFAIDRGGMNPLRDALT